MKIPEILLVETFHKPGSLASVLAVIADEQLAIEYLQSLRRQQGRTLWESTVEIDEQANPGFYSGIDALPNARFVGKSDRVFNRHRGGKIHMQPTLAITTQQVLRDIYAPGVARVCLAIRDDPSKAALVGVTAVPILIDSHDNNVAALPGLFKGALEAGVPRFTDEMLVAAAHALAKRAGPEELLPDPLNLDTHRAVTAAVRAAAIEPVSTALLYSANKRRPAHRL